MLDRKNLVALAKAAVKAEKNAPVAYSFDGQNYSYDEVQTTLREELNSLAGNIYDYNQNKNLIFSIVSEVIDEFLPKKVEGIYSMLAEVRQYPQGTTPEFKIKSTASRLRAKTFITRAAIEGVYEVFKLGGAQTVKIQATAFAGAAQVGFEEVLDGRVDFAELIDIVIEGIEDRIQEEVALGLSAGLAQLPAVNKVEFAGFSAEQFDHLLVIAKGYGAGNPVIYCDQMFASKLLPNTDASMIPDAVKAELWEKGYLGYYKQCPVVILPNGLKDHTNDGYTLQYGPENCYIMPGTGMKPIFIGFEGETQVREYENRDWSKEIQMYKKVGVGVHFTKDICVYTDTSLKGKDSYSRV